MMEEGGAAAAVPPPGEFGYLGGAIDSVRFARNPAAFVTQRKAKYGSVFKAKIAAKHSVFSAGHANTSQLLSSPSFPSHLSLLRLVRGAVGEAFTLCPSAKEVEWWLGALRGGLYKE
eukprot:Hpha_TRINITY_DN18116_c0_g1::TRINITY_DN18116_c0_g1_i1::g.84622::m.84622